MKNGETAKQYLPLLNKPMLHYSLALFAACADIQDIFVVLSVGDEKFTHYFGQAGIYENKVKPFYCGGATRAQSVYNGLLEMRGLVQEQDWVLVHDAARPCLSEDDLKKLLEAFGPVDVGGLLAVPVADTLKKSDSELNIVSTENREHLWRAQTPQMFRYKLLCDALAACAARTPTDEAQAVEWLGFKPKLVAGNAANMKVTYPEDIQLAEFILKTRGKPKCA
jgi:2-C-methyl-D-erythritol 4-phosphate cytidylyltransferase